MTAGPPAASDRRRVLLVCSPGGHLFQMLCLEGAWSELERTWVTLRAPDTDNLLSGERVVHATGPTERSLRALLANLRLAWRTVRRERPDAILSTGAALAFPFFLAGRLTGSRLIYVESLTRTERLSLTGRLVYRLADAFFVQWPTADTRKRTRYAGNLL